MLDTKVKATPTIKGTSFVKASSISVPDIFFRPVDTSIPEVNMALSELGGIIPSQVIFMTGKPGSGKTTLAALIAANISKKYGNPGAIISLEMSDFQLAAMGRKIPGFGNTSITTSFNLTTMFDELRLLNPCVIILDSIQKAAGRMPGGFNKNQKLIVDAFTMFAKETFIPVILIGHVNKSGVYLGPTALLHEVDTHLAVNFDRENDLRTFNGEKNRFGGNNFEYLFGIKSDKVWVGNPYLESVFPGAKSEPKKINPDLVVSAELMKSTLTRFYQDNEARQSISENTSRAICDIWLSYMKTIDKEEIEKNSNVGSIDKISLKHDYNGVAQCHHKGGQAFIRIGEKMFKKEFVIGKIGYGREQRFIKDNCKSREDLFIWVLIHEWCHLYKGHGHHKLEFFESVQKVWRKFQSSLA